MTEAEWVPKAQAEGAQIIRLEVGLGPVAPSRPADPTNPSSRGYDWTTVDEQVRELAAGGFKILITVRQRTKMGGGREHAASPRYAGAWRPNLAAYAAFTEALAKRYDGTFADPLNPGAELPRVKYWQAWDEPNLPEYLSPQWVKSGENSSRRAR